MNQLPEQPAETAGQPALDDQARMFLAAVEDAMRTPTSYRDDSPVPAIGSAPPVEQPGRPAMSKGATDASVLMMAGGFLSLCLGAAVSAVLHFSGNANETVVIAVCAGPPAGFLALKSLVKGIKQAAPDTHHHHYNGNVHQDYSTVNTNTRGVWAHTRNQLPK